MWRYRASCRIFFGMVCKDDGDLMADVHEGKDLH